MNPSHFLSRKSNLFTIILAIVIGLLAIPVIIPHVLHGYHMVHIGIHVAGLTLSTFLSILAVMAYKSLKTKKMFSNIIIIFKMKDRIIRKINNKNNKNKIIKINKIDIF